MESSGVAGAVQLSAATWAALRLPEAAAAECDALVPPMERDIKGKGPMGTRTVHAGTPAAARLRALLDEPWPDAGEELPLGVPKLGLPPRQPRRSWAAAGPAAGPV
jgi:hypothetical protein